MRKNRPEDAMGILPAILADAGRIGLEIVRLLSGFLKERWK
jgi:hypothetical protein